MCQEQSPQAARMRVCNRAGSASHTTAHTHTHTHTHTPAAAPAGLSPWLGSSLPRWRCCPLPAAGAQTRGRCPARVPSVCQAPAQLVRVRCLRLRRFHTNTTHTNKHLAASSHHDGLVGQHRLRRHRAAARPECCAGEAAAQAPGLQQLLAAGLAEHVVVGQLLTGARELEFLISQIFGRGGCKWER
jgi:hypothetical protein